MQQTLTLEFLF